jgi:phenylacetate-CoA ligase
MTDLRRLLAQRVSEPLFWTVLKRRSVRRLCARMRTLQMDEPSVFQARQDRALANLLMHAHAQIPFYRERTAAIPGRLIQERPREALARFPILRKSDLREHDGSLWIELGRGTYTNYSGGTTGTPVRVRQDLTYLDAALATAVLSYEWAGFSVGERHVKLWGARRDLVPRRIVFGRRVSDWPFNRLTLDAFDMGSAEMHEHVGRINRFQPVCIEGYVDALYEIARMAQSEHLSVASPRCIVSGASTLHPHMRNLISRVFGAPVFDRYGSREAGAIASECERHAGLHVLGETGLVEVVDEDGNEVEPGSAGRILVTNLWNMTMPLIRYDIGDRGVRGPAECACGRPYPLLQKILGRSEASFRLPDGGVVLPEFFIHVIGVEFAGRGVAKFQVVQEALDWITVRLVLDRVAAPDRGALVNELTARIREIMSERCRVDFEFPMSIEPSPTGKHLYTVRRPTVE